MKRGGWAEWVEMGDGQSSRAAFNDVIEKKKNYSLTLTLFFPIQLYIFYEIKL